MSNNNNCYGTINIILSLLISFIMFSPAVSAQEQSEGTVDAFSTSIREQINLEVNAATAIDLETGQFLFKYNDDQLHGIASLTKLISLYVVYEEIQAGNLSLDTKIPISEEVSVLSRQASLSNVPLDVSTDLYTVDMLIDAAIIPSANGAVIALAEYIAGSEKNFVSLMKNKLTELGINDYELYTASGLSGENLTGTHSLTSEHENKMQARDILFVAHQLVTDFPEVMTRSQTTAKPFQINDSQAVNMLNTNEFLPGKPYQRDDVFGLKTGTEDYTGACIIVITQIDDRPVMLVTLGAENNDARFIQTGNLIDILQQNLAWTVLVEADQNWQESEKVNVYQGKTETTTLSYKQTNAVFLPKNYAKEKYIQAKYGQAWQYGTDGHIVVNAPLAAGDVINTYEMDIPFIEPLFNNIAVENAIIASEDVEKVNAIFQIVRIMADMFSSWSNQVSDFIVNE